MHKSLDKNKLIRKFEEMSLNAWPASETHYYDGWVIRFTQGYTKRANSINPIYSSSINIDLKINICEGLYQDANLPTVFKITECSHPNELDKALESRGYKRIDEVSMQIIDLESFEALTNINEIIINSKITQTWIDGYAKCSNIINPVNILIMTNLLFSIDKEVICVSIEKDGTSIAHGLGVIEDTYIGIFDIIVSKAYRGKGYGKAIVEEILQQAKSKDIKYAYLQVLKNNTIANNLYKQLGFRQLYTYWYRVKGNKDIIYIQSD